jgi:hypothetical protein
VAGCDKYAEEAREYMSPVVRPFIDVRDLAKTQDFGGVRYELVLCIEVAEHLTGGIPASYALTENLVRLVEPDGRILFTAAAPGQPGRGHVNCRPLTFWQTLFDDAGARPDKQGTKAAVKALADIGDPCDLAQKALVVRGPGWTRAGLPVTNCNNAQDETSR